MGWAPSSAAAWAVMKRSVASDRRSKRNLLLLLLLWLSFTKTKGGSFQFSETTLWWALSLLHLLLCRRYYTRSLAQCAAKRSSLVRPIATFRDSLHSTKDIYWTTYIYIQIFSTVDSIVFPSGRRRTWWGVCYFLCVCKIQVLYTRWLRRQVHVATSKSNSNNLIAGTTGIVRLWSIITALVSARPCEPWKVKNLSRIVVIKYFFRFYETTRVI